MNSTFAVDYLVDLYHENKLAHAYLIETNNISKCLEDIKQVIKRINCQNEFKLECNKCNLCHLLENNLLPSFILIEPDGKIIKKESIETLKNTFSNKPIYTKKNIYVMISPEKMNDTAFNKLLKFVEEPEDNIIGFFITKNKDYVANTITSRCESIKILYNTDELEESYDLEEIDYNVYFEIANEYLKLIEDSNKNVIWYNNSVILKKISERTQIISFVKIIYKIIQQQIHISNNREINIKKLQIVEKYLDELNFNTNTSLLLDSMTIELGELYE